MTKPGFSLPRGELTAVLWTFRREFVVVGVFSLVANVLLLTPTLYMLQVYDRVLVSQSELTLLALSLITLFLYLVMAFCEWMRSRVLVLAGLRLDEQLGTRVFQASFDAHLNASAAASPRAFGDLIQVRQFLTGNGIFAFFDTPWVPIYIGVLFILHPWLGIMAIVFALLQGALVWWGHARCVAPAQAASQAASQTQAFLQGKLRSAEVLESMGMVGNLLGHWRERHQTFLTRSAAAQGLNHRVGAFSKFLRYTQQSLALGMGALLVIDGQLSPGAMIAANVLTSRALAPIDMMAGMWHSFMSAHQAFHRLQALLEQYPARQAAVTHAAPCGEIVLRDVVASVQGRTAPILQGISLTAQPGSVTVVLGPSGSGKSTLARVLMGIWPETSGQVLLDGQPIQGWDRSALGPHLGYLPQDIELFEGSIAENIARFSEVDAAKVIRAAQSAGLHEAILRFPKGYDTPIGEAGQLLSGGQSQRIGLARALYGNPALVVLDEPNANLDDAGEAALMSAVRELRTLGKTVFLITHRPGALVLADQLIVLQDGRIRLAGARESVMAALREAAETAASPTPARQLPALQT